MQQTFSIGEAISYGYNRAKANWQFLSVFALVIVAASFVFRLLLSMANRGGVIVFFILYVANILVSFYLSAALIKVGLLEGRGVQTTWQNAWSVDKTTYWRFFRASILLVLVHIGVAVVLGGLFFVTTYAAGNAAALVYAILGALYVVVAALLVIRLNLTNFSAVDGGTTGMGSIKRSWTITRGNFWKLLGFVVLLGLINLLGLIVLVVGLLFTVPLTVVATAFVYEKLKGAEVPEVPIAA